MLAAAVLASPRRGPERPYDVLHIDAELAPDEATRTLRARAVVTMTSRVPALDVVELDAEGLVVEAVEESGQRVAFESLPGVLRVTLAAPARRGERRAISISYTARAGKGLHFYPGGWYTAFDTQTWLPCNARPDDRATATLRWAVRAGQKLIATQATRPFPAYVLGAVAGNFTSTCARAAGGVEICSWADPAWAAKLAPTVEIAAAALARFTQWAGLPFPGRRYDQVFVPDRIAQELAGAAIIRDGTLDDLAAEPREDWLVIHELAHSYWGNLVTARSWSDFWLNEGIVTFLVAAAKERRWDHVEYEQEMALARRRYDRARRSGRDRALVTDRWSRPSDMSGPVTYSKGALVMSLLRHELGERAFWAGLRAYTRAGAVAAGGVVSADLQHAMERASGRDLGALFAVWVHGAAGTPDIAASHRVEGNEVIVTVEQQQPAAGGIPLAIAIETTAGRARRRLVLRQPVEEARFALGGAELRAVRVDDGGVLPVRVRHPRPPAMLLWQIEHEPDAVGRFEALEQLQEICEAPATRADPACVARAAALAARAPREPARLLRKELEAAAASSGISR